MFTFENTKEATHIHAGPETFTFHNFAAGRFLNAKRNEWKVCYFDHPSTSRSYIELSRPAGERKEDHTIDGVVTYALKYKLDDNPDEPAPVAESMIGSSEYYQTGGNPQTIEPWVGDQLEDLINTVSEGCQANTGAIPGQPVFTQEMRKAGETPAVGCELVSSETGNVIVCRATFGSYIWATIKNSGYKPRTFTPMEYEPIDNRSDTQKIISELLDIWEEANGRTEIFQAIVDSDKFTITLKE